MVEFGNTQIRQITQQVLKVSVFSVELVGHYTEEDAHSISDCKVYEHLLLF